MQIYDPAIGFGACVEKLENIENITTDNYYFTSVLDLFSLISINEVEVERKGTEKEKPEKHFRISSPLWYVHNW